MAALRGDISFRYLKQFFLVTYYVCEVLCKDFWFHLSWQKMWLSWHLHEQFLFMIGRRHFLMWKYNKNMWRPLQKFLHYIYICPKNDHHWQFCFLIVLLQSSEKLLFTLFVFALFSASQQQQQQRNQPPPPPQQYAPPPQEADRFAGKGVGLVFKNNKE